jgi:hypothetical protein
MAVKQASTQLSAFAILESASHHVYDEVQRARTREEHEDFAITLKLLGLLRDGWSTGPAVFDVACGYAVGLCHARYLYKRAERSAFMRLYDSITSRNPDEDIEAAGERFGDRPNADDLYSAPSRARAADDAALPAAYSRIAPKRISSPAQQAFLERARDVASYCGA